jgi:hypothetical protein
VPHIERSALQSILHEVYRLSEKVHRTSEPRQRVELLKQIRMLLGDADKIISSEMGDN